MNLINLENVRKAYGPEPLLDGVSLGVDEADRIGVVGRNGGGKTTLMSLLARHTGPTAGRVTHARGLRLAFLAQRDEFAGSEAVRGTVLGDRPEHEWAGDPRIRDILAGLLDEVPLDAPLARMSGGELRRVALARLLVPQTDLLILDEPTNHLDVEAIDWLARHLKARRGALVAVTHDRWFLDEVTDRTWEVVGGRVERYEGGYSAYVLARAERERLAVAAEEKRRNLLRKELAWLRRGPQARSSKPKFRVDAAQALIADVPPLRDSVELTRFATARLGKTVYDLEDVSVRLGTRDVFDHMTWRLGPGDRVGLIGANGSGKTTLLRLLDGTVTPDAGRLVRGKTVQLAHLSQDLADLDPDRRVLESVEEISRRITVGRREWTASQLLERLGFRGDAQWTPVADLSGGERRRLQLLRLLMAEPNVLLLDEPTNDLDIETLTELEDLLDGWPGTLVVVSHDRYFLERVTDHMVALLGDGRPALLPGGVAEYLTRRRIPGTPPTPQARSKKQVGPAGPNRPVEPAGRNKPAEQAGPNKPAEQARPKSAAQDWKAKKQLDKLERRLEKLAARATELHEQLAAHATDHEKLQDLTEQLKAVETETAEVEEEWLTLAEATTTP